ncbi:uncharacterized protein BT62DRAFT_912693 [Guyanagaster necrorhizus]|uniref:Uncharacterized protein n=1 Tax=Guyanagaster necrorhizus TaxID=856835 RepID=A0A9P8AKZ8_9AGAR|nr:uncharacterized protein BT62DRAFT_912693 [Guyanagaster necrorhizus MCA 3950]KAG7439713.1 hypothetical protein BT62DRAFT_912693 [Guyanagaster necrorhizus MCA 3950]
MVFVLIIRHDQNVIEINHNLSSDDEILKDVVYHPLSNTLKGHRQINEPEKHYHWFKQSPVGLESCFPLISFLDLDIIVSPPHVEFGIVLDSMQFVYQFGDKQSGTVILDHHLIQLLVVLNQSEFAVLLLYEEEGGSHGRLRRSNLPGG